MAFNNSSAVEDTLKDVKKVMISPQKCTDAHGRIHQNRDVGGRNAPPRTSALGLISFPGTGRQIAGSQLMLAMTISPLSGIGLLEINIT